ncbi:hypothetical protein SPONL_898 [uncultured Candidatus Thioglobus sp.]|nr:hypothetical protein SPONL_898 [uncultured Candidatus Thioglobus sp.]
MIQKIVNALKLDRVIRYYVLLYVLVILLTYANNFFFYQSVSAKEWSNSGNYIASLDKYAALCMDLTNNRNQCVDKVKGFAKDNVDYYGHLILINGDTIIDNRRYKDERVEIKRVADLLSINLSIEVTKNPIPNIWSSVIKSATFSASDIIERISRGDSNEEILKFVTHTAMWRSFPHLAFLFIVLFVSAFMKKSIVAQIEFINKFESEVVDNDGPSY